MNNIKMRKKYAIDNKAYTLIEALMSLFVFSIVIFSLLAFLNVEKTNIDNNYDFKEISLFFSQIQEDFLQSQKIKVKNSKELDVINYLGEEVEYKYDKNRLIRQKNNQGYEIVLNQIENLNFFIQKKLLYLSIKFQDNDRIYEWVLTNVAE